MKHMKIWSALLLCVILMISCTTTSSSASNGQEASTVASNGQAASTVANSNVNMYGYSMHVYTDAAGKTLTYYLYIPSNYNPQRKYPLVLLLHGGGERSNPQASLAQNQKTLLQQQYVQVWSGDYSAPNNPEVQQHWPSFIVVPQISAGQQWVNVPVHNGSYVQPAQPSTQLLLTKELLDTLQQRYSGIDANRLYITGLSLGGYGVWDAIERWPGYFAAAAPLAGAGDPSKAALLTHLPIWAFHGSNDTTVPVSGSRSMIAAIKAAGGDPRYTEFAGASHAIWGSVYAAPNVPNQVTDFFPWLFAQVRPATQ